MQCNGAKVTKIILLTHKAIKMFCPSIPKMEGLIGSKNMTNYANFFTHMLRLQRMTAHNA